MGKYFKLNASVNSNDVNAVLPVLEKYIGKNATINKIGQELEISATIEGEDARELNRQILSEMRKVEKKTRLRSEWSCDGVTEKFFDYVPKGKRQDK
ncbi:MAG: hypothetical protein AAE977_06685 [Thermoplasmataceae archaeon]|jgi:hypothetical protein